MTDEKTMQFRVGIFVLAGLVVAAIMAFQFGEFRHLWEPRYTLAIHFDDAPGVAPSTPVRQNGIPIGSVSEIVIDNEHGGVLVLASIREKFRLRKDARPKLSVSLLGDANIEFSVGQSREFFGQGDRLKGMPPVDPMNIVNRMEEQMSVTMNAFQDTTRQWEEVGQNVNSLLGTNRENLGLAIERAAVGLEQFAVTMQNADRALSEANKVLADPQVQEDLRRTIAALPRMVSETQNTISAIKQSVQSADQTLSHLSQATEPLAKKSASIINKLDRTLGSMESLAEELNDAAQMVTKKDGTFFKLTSDPELYRNLNQSTASLAVLLKNLDPIVRDIRIFSDKVARHPELMGVRGAINPSSGLKDVPKTGLDSQVGDTVPRGRSRR